MHILYVIFYLYISLKPCQLTGPRSSNITAAVSTPSTQVLISEYHFPLNKSGIFEEMTALGLVQGQHKWAWRILVCQKERKYLKINEVMSKGHRILLEGVPTCQVWDNLNIKKRMTVMDYNPLKFFGRKKIHESIIILKKETFKEKNSI